jgi:hypothetical protein
MASFGPAVGKAVSIVVTQFIQLQSERCIKHMYLQIM